MDGQARIGLEARPMTILPDDVVQRARERGPQAALPPWPGVLVSGDVPALRHRLASAIAVAPAPVRDALVTGFATGTDLGLGGLARLWTVGLARTAGWQVTAVEGGVVHVERGAERAALVPVPVPGPAARRAELEGLERRLGVVFGDRPWTLFLRGTLPEHLEAEHLLEPVRQWLAGLRGPGTGDYRIYMEDGLSLELGIVGGQPSPGGHARLRAACPHGERLALQVEARLVAALDGVDLGPEVPRIPVLVRGGPWPLSPRAVLDLLYGKLVEQVVDRRGRSFTFRSDGGGVLARESLGRVGAVWWLGAHPTDPLVPVGRACENPWGHAPAAGPAFPGERLSVAFTGEVSDGVTLATLHQHRPDRPLVHARPRPPTSPETGP
jgi:hypothetical protein